MGQPPALHALLQSYEVDPSLLVASAAASHRSAVPELFDIKLRALRRDRAARLCPELFLFERLFEDCLERIALIGRSFESGLLIGCPDPGWPKRLMAFAKTVEVRDPGELFASKAGGTVIVEDTWHPPSEAYDLVLAIGTLDTVNDLPLALHLIRRSMRHEGLLLGVAPGGDTIPELRAAMRVADGVSGAATPHVHPRIEASALAPLLVDAGFERPVVDVERVRVSYRSLARLVADLRAMAATNLLTARGRPLSRLEGDAASQAFRAAGDGARTIETFEFLHFAGWTSLRMMPR